MTHFITKQDVHDVYAEYGITLGDANAEAELAFLNRHATSQADAIHLLHKYAQQERAEVIGDMREAASFDDIKDEA